MKFAVKMRWEVLPMCLALIVLSVGEDSGSTITPQSSAVDLQRGNYIVVAPNQLVAGQKYIVCVTILNTVNKNEPVHLTADLGGQPYDQSKPRVQISKSETITNGETKTLQLPVGDWPAGNYGLNVTATGGLTFRRKISYLALNEKRNVNFIQTDKGIYKPGQTVNFRVLLLDRNLKPTIKTPIQISVKDPNDNTIALYSNVTLPKGIYSDKIQLSDQPPLGSWKIEVKSANTHPDDSNTFDPSDSVYEIIAFDVQEYVLPTFEVSIDPPKSPTFSDRNISVAINAKYTYGKAVGGSVVFKATSRSYLNCFGAIKPTDWYYKDCIQYTISKNATLERGTVNVTLDLIKEVGLTDNGYGQSIQVFAEVTEELTGQKRNTTTTFTVFSKATKIQLVQINPYFKPGLTNLIYVKVTYQDGRLIEPQNLKDVLVQYKFFPNEEDYDNGEVDLVKGTEYHLTDTGLIPLEIHPKVDDGYLIIKATYDNATERFYIQARDQVSRRLLDITLANKTHCVGDNLEFTVQSTHPLPYLIIQVISQGTILTTRAMDGKKSNRAFISMRSIDAMAPASSLLVYYLSGCGELIADSVNFLVKAAPNKKVTLAVSSALAKPGEDIEVTITSEPNAFIGVSAVDKAVQLLSKANELTPESIQAKTGTNSNFDVAGLMKLPVSYQGVNGKSTQEIFTTVGVQVLTDGYLTKPQSRIFRYGAPNIRYKSTTAHSVAMSAVAFDAAPGAPGLESASVNRIANAPAMGGGSAEPITIRKNFAETFLWVNDTTNDKGELKLKARVPDVITTWNINSFSLEKVLGLVATPTQELKVLKDFFIVLNLPYSVVRGEVVVVQALVFNYMSKDVDAKVTLNTNNSGFDLAETFAPQNPQNVHVPTGEGKSVSFLIKPKAIGNIAIELTAVSSEATDGLSRKLLVKPEGIAVYRNIPVFIDLKNKTSQADDVKVDIPNDIVSSSQRIQAWFTGDVFGPTINNFGNLIRIPYGCGEQNMINFAPDVSIWNYLQTTGRLSPKWKQELKTALESGYQRELTYHRSDGSFSAFGEVDKEGSLWLTAFVLSSFARANSFITIDSNVLRTSLAFVVDKQNKDGSFSPIGFVHHKPLLGGNSNNLDLTAYILLSLLDAKNVDVAVSGPVIEKSVKYLEDSLAGLTDVYDTVLVTYALHKAKSPSKDAAFATMETLSRKSAQQVYWSRYLSKDVQGSSPRPEDVEMTGYALLIYVMRGETNRAFPIFSWLIAHRSELGGYSSTQDTVVAIDALANYAAVIYEANIGLKSTFKFGNATHTFSVDNNNAIVLQQELLSLGSTGDVSILSEGHGTALAQISYSYNVLKADDFKFFEVTAKLLDDSNKFFIHLEVCIKYVSENETSMVLVEVNLPSGFEVLTEELSNLKSIRQFSKSQAQDSNSLVVLYFNQLASQESVCPTIKAYRTTKVAELKPALIVAYDYYDNVKRASAFYNGPNATVCELCSMDDSCSWSNCPK